MRISITENRNERNEKEIIMDVGTVEKRKDYRSFGDCLIIDGMIFPTGEKTNEMYLSMLKDGYLDLAQYEKYETGI